MSSFHAKLLEGDQNKQSKMNQTKHWRKPKKCQSHPHGLFIRLFILPNCYLLKYSSMAMQIKGILWKKKYDTDTSEAWSLINHILLKRKSKKNSNASLSKWVMLLLWLFSIFKLRHFLKWPSFPINQPSKRDRRDVVSWFISYWITVLRALKKRNKICKRF